LIAGPLFAIRRDGEPKYSGKLEGELKTTKRELIFYFTWLQGPSDFQRRDNKQKTSFNLCPNKKSQGQEKGSKTHGKRGFHSSLGFVVQ